MRVIRIDKNNQVNGDGLRCVIWFAGCEHHCAECHNPETWNYDQGHAFGLDDWNIIDQQLKSDEIDGLTLTGGDPLSVKNRLEVAKLCASFKELYPNKTIWCYTGHLYEELKKEGILTHIDVLIDGRYIKDLNPGIGKAKWRGSTNQRVIDVQASIQANQIVLWKDWDGTIIDQNH